MTSFGLGVWLFQSTGSYESYALLAIMTPLAVLIFAPIAGHVVDKSDLRLVLVCSNALSAATAALLALLFVFNSLDFRIAVAASLVLSIASEFRYTATSPTVTALAPPDRLLQLNSLQQTFRGASLMLAPLMAAVCINYLGFAHLLVFDLLTFLLSLAVVVLHEIPSADDGLGPARPTGLLASIREGVAWIAADRALTTLLIFFLLVNGALAFFHVSLPPYVLASASSMSLGYVMAAVGAGVMVAGATLAGLRRQVRPSYLMLGALLVCALSILVLSVSRSAVALCICSFLAGASISTMGSTNQTIWQQRTPKSVQGRVVATRSVAMYLLSPISILVSIPAVERVFAPVASAMPFLGGYGRDGLSGALGLLMLSVGAALMVILLITLALGWHRKWLRAEDGV